MWRTQPLMAVIHQKDVATGSFLSPAHQYLHPLELPERRHANFVMN